MDYQILTLLFSVFVLIPLAGYKIFGMVIKIQKMSSRENEENYDLTPKQKEFVQFLEKASNQSKKWHFQQVGNFIKGNQIKLFGFTSALKVMIYLVWLSELINGGRQDIQITKCGSVQKQNLSKLKVANCIFSSFDNQRYCLCLSIAKVEIRLRRFLNFVQLFQQFILD